MFKKIINKIEFHILLIVLLSFLIKNFIFKNPFAYFIDPDSPAYISQVENLVNGYGYSIKDYTDEQIKPTAYRMPLLQFTAFIIVKTLNLSSDSSVFAIAIINFISWILIILLSIFISYILTQDKTISIITGYLTLFNINLFYNSVLILTDTFFSFTISLFILSFIYSLKYSQKKYLFFLSGFLLGFTLLTRPITKFLILFLIPVIFTIKELNRKEKVKSILLLTLGLIITISPWIIRNYKKLGFIGLETNQGLNTIWSTSSLIEIKEKDKNDPIIYEIKKIIIEDRKECPWPIGAEFKARKKLNLSEVEMSKYFQKIGIETVLSHPFKFIKIFIRNLINNITSATSELKMIDILFKKGYYDEQHKIMIRFENIEKSEEKDISLKEYIKIMPNFIFRIIHLLSFIIAIIGAIIFTKKYKKEGIFLITIISYLLIFTSFVASYDRYRLPVEMILNFFVVYTIFRLYKDKICFLKKH